jgi:hypothetical protein
LLRQFIMGFAAGGLMAVPAQASAAEYHASETRMGAFVGAQFRLSLGGKSGARPRAGLALAPVASRASSRGEIRTNIGEGIALNFNAGSKPSLTLAGVRADRALGLAGAREVGAKNKMGLSTGAWVGIGVVAAIGVTTLLFIDYCNDKESSLCGDSE